MTQWSLLAGLGAVLAIGAVCTAVALARGWRPAVRKLRLRRRGQRALGDLPTRWRANYRTLLAGAGVAGVGVWAWTGWPIHGLLTAGALAGLPFLLHPGGSAQRRIARLDALAQWLHQLASIHIAGSSLEQTIAVSAGNSPAVLREPVTAAALRLRQGLPPREVYALLADELADTASDEVALLLMEHAEGRGPGLSAALATAAEGVGAQADDFRAVDADRAKVRSNARWVSLFTVFVVVVCMLNTSYTAPYASSLGQLVLSGMGVLFVGALMWMRKMAQPRPEPRLLLPRAETTTQEELL